MTTLNRLKRRFKLARNMLEESRRGAAWGQQAFAGQGTTGDAEEVGELAAWVETHEKGRGVHKWQHYLPIYERHFERFRGTDVHLVEIGVGSGGSLDMWRDYFGPKSHIYGIDVNETCRQYATEGIDIFIGDQADPAFWTQFKKDVPDVDIVIDDGGHRAFQQIPTLEALLPHIRTGGVYLCEDIHGPYHEFHDYLFGLSRNLHSYRAGAIRAGAPASDFQRAIGSFHFYPFVAVIEKRESPFEWMSAPRHGTEWRPRN